MSLREWSRGGIDRTVPGDFPGGCEEVEIYKERLREIEAAFRYNLNLLTDRDLELDALEEQLRNGISEVERISQQKSDCEELHKRVDEERMKEIRSLRKKLQSREEAIRQLKRRNLGNLTTLKGTIQTLKREQREEMVKMADKLQREKCKMEKNLVEIIHLKETKHAEEINQLNGKYMNQLDEMTREKRQLCSYKAENRDLKAMLLQLRKEKEDMEESYRTRVDRLDGLYERVSSELENISEARAGKMREKVESRGTWAKPSSSAATTQTEKDCDSVDPRDFALVQQQNNVLRCIIKDMKRNRGKQDARRSGDPCPECRSVRDKIEETNKRFESEISELKKAVENEKSQRTEEESIIQNLESSVVCLKERLLTGLHRNLENLTEGDLCSYTYNRELQNELQVSLMEDRLNKRMEEIVKMADDEREDLDRKLKAVKSDVAEEVNGFLGCVRSRERKTEQLLEEIRREVKNLEGKIGNDGSGAVDGKGDGGRAAAGTVRPPSLPADGFYGSGKKGNASPERVPALSVRRMTLNSRRDARR